MATVDTKWFLNRLRDLGISQRKLSAAISTNPHAMTRILRGERKVAHDEIPTIAKMLDTTQEEVLRRLGVSSPITKRAGSIPVTGTVNETGRVEEARASETAKAPGEDFQPNRAEAIVYRAAGFDSPPWVQGWVLYARRPVQPRGVDADSLDRMCIVQIDDGEARFVGVPRRSTEQGRYDLINPFTGETFIRSTLIRSAIPVSWINAA